MLIEDGSFDCNGIVCFGSWSGMITLERQVLEVDVVELLPFALLDVGNLELLFRFAFLEPFCLRCVGASALDCEGGG